METTLEIRVLSDVTSVKRGMAEVQDTLAKTEGAATRTAQRIQTASSAIGKAGADAGRSYAAGLEQAFQADQARIREGIARGLLKPADAQRAGRDAAQAFNQGVLSQLDQLGRAGQNVGNSKVYRDLAGSIKNVGVEGAKAGLNLNSLKESVGSMAAQALGANPIVGRLGNVIGGLALGTATTVGVLAGIAAIGLAYNKLTEGARKTREEHERLVKVLDDVAKRRATTPTTELQKAITAKQQDLDKLRQNLAAITPADLPVDTESRFAEQAGGIRSARVAEQIRDVQQKIAQGERELTEMFKRGAEERSRAMTSELATLVSTGRASNEQRRQATLLLKGYEDSLAALQRTAPGATAAQASLVEQINQLKGAFSSASKEAQGFGQKTQAATGTLADDFKAASDRAATVIAAVQNMKNGLEPIPGLGAEMADAMSGVERIIGSIGNRFDETRLKAEALLLTLQKTLKEAIGVTSAGNLPVTFAAPRITPNIAGPGQVNIGGITAPAPQAAAITLGPVPTKLDAIREATAQGAKEMVLALNSVGNQLAGQIGGLTGAFASMRNSTGGQIGGALGGAFGAGVGSFAGSALGTSIGGAIGAGVGSVIPVVGTVIGGLLGSAIGGLFSKPKRATDAAATALDNFRETVDRVNESISNIPQWFKIAPFRFAAAAPVVPPAPVSPAMPISGGGSGGRPSPGGATVPKSINIEHLVVNSHATSLKQLLADIEDTANRKKATGAASGFAFAYQT